MNSIVALARQPAPAPLRLRVVCLPHAGGGTAAYQGWPSLVPDDVEVWAARLPGRENRFLEAPVEEMAVLVDGLFAEVAAIADQPYALFGHSMGAVVAFALCLRLEQGSVPPPALLIASGHEAPHTDWSRNYHLLGDHELTALLSSLSGTPPEVLSDPQVMELFLPTIRADLALLETYRPGIDERVGCPVVTYIGADDDLQPEAVSRWDELTTGPCTHRVFPGGHFYLDQQRAEVVACVVADATAAMAGRPLLESSSVGPAT